MEQRDLWDYVSGEVTKPDGAETADTVKAFRKKQKQARAFMLTRVEAGQLAHMLDPDPKVIWDDLVKVHQARGFASALSMRRDFMEMKMSEGQTMASWISSVKAAAFALKSTAAPASDMDTIIILTKGLPPSYATFIVTLDSVEPKLLTVDYVITRLANERVRQHGDDQRELKKGLEADAIKKEEEIEAALSAYRASGGRNRNMKDVECFACGEMGHYKSACPELKKRKQAETAAIALGAYGHDSTNFAF